MNFRLTDEQRLIRKAARDFASKELGPNARQWEESGTFSREAFDKMGAWDFTGPYVPEEYGGAAVGRLTAAALTAKAVKTDAGYILNGTKLYVASGGVADIYAVVVRTDEARKQKVDHRRGG
jgi:alkylation response protein AidB-like acyl-CoA dehydrogenase